MATTKKNLIDRIAESTGTRQSLVKRVVQQFFGDVIHEMTQGNRIELRDFGVFATKTTPARVSRNPRTLKKVQVPAKLADCRGDHPCSVGPQWAGDLETEIPGNPFAVRPGDIPDHLRGYCGLYTRTGRE